jgi:hypothetical protein
VNLANLYRETGLTRFSHPDLISKRHKRSAVTEPAPVRAATRESSYVSRQWHLTAAQVVNAWSITRGVRDVRVAILDDGVDVAHPEFGGKVGPQFDFTAHTATGTPQFASDNHGTACAGVATAKGLHMAGAARECTLMPVRFPAVLGDADEAKMGPCGPDRQHRSAAGQYPDGDPLLRHRRPQRQRHPRAVGGRQRRRVGRPRRLRRQP